MSRFVLSFFVISALIFAGCNSDEPTRPAGMPSLKPCTVIVTEDGASLHSTIVRLFNEDGTPPKWAILGVTDLAGKARIVTHDFTGAPAGKYKVTLSRQLRPGAPDPLPPTASDEEQSAYGAVCAKLPPAKETMPDDYLKPETTPLIITVGSAKEITVEVKR